MQPSHADNPFALAGLAMSDPRKAVGKQRLRAGERADRDFTIRMPGGIAQSDLGGLLYEHEAAIEDEGDAVCAGRGSRDVRRLRHGR